MAAKGVREKASLKAAELDAAAQRHLSDARNVFVGMLLSGIFSAAGVFVQATITPFSQQIMMRALLIIGGAMGAALIYYQMLIMKAVAKTGEAILWKLRSEAPNKTLSLDDWVRQTAGRVGRKSIDVRQVLLNNVGELPIQVRIIEPAERETPRTPDE